MNGIMIVTEFNPKTKSTSAQQLWQQMSESSKH